MALLTDEHHHTAISGVRKFLDRAGGRLAPIAVAAVPSQGLALDRRVVMREVGSRLGVMLRGASERSDGAVEDVLAVVSAFVAQCVRGGTSPWQPATLLRVNVAAVLDACGRASTNDTASETAGAVGTGTGTGAGAGAAVDSSQVAGAPVESISDGTAAAPLRERVIRAIADGVSSGVRLGVSSHRTNQVTHTSSSSSPPPPLPSSSSSNDHSSASPDAIHATVDSVLSVLDATRYAGPVCAAAFLGGPDTVAALYAVCVPPQVTPPEVAVTDGSPPCVCIRAGADVSNEEGVVDSAASRPASHSDLLVRLCATAAYVYVCIAL